jgi:hypothetical protein
MKDETFEIGLPDKIEFSDHGHYIGIIRKWFGLPIIILTFFVIFWDGFLFFWYSKAIQSQNTMFLLFPLIHVAAGIVLTYTAIAGYINKTYIRVDKSSIAIKDSPLPFFRNKTLNSSDIKQLFSKEKITGGRGGSSVSYEVHAITKDKKRIKLLKGLESSEQALFIEQEIEKFLKIEDKRVKGEI